MTYYVNYGIIVLILSVEMRFILLGRLYIMLITTSDRISMAMSVWDQADSKWKLLIGTKGNKDTHFHPAFIALDWTNANDMQELELLTEITGITGEVKYESELIGKTVRLIADITRKSLTKVDITPYALGHKKEKSGEDNFFLVLNAHRELLSEEKAKELIRNEFLKK